MVCGTPAVLYDLIISIESKTQPPPLLESNDFLWKDKKIIAYIIHNCTFFKPVYFLAYNCPFKVY